MLGLGPERLDLGADRKLLGLGTLDASWAGEAAGLDLETDRLAAVFVTQTGWTLT